MKRLVLALVALAVASGALAYAATYSGTGYSAASCCCAPEHSADCTTQNVTHSDPVTVIVNTTPTASNAGQQPTNLSGTAETGVPLGKCKKVEYTFWCTLVGSAWECTLSTWTVIQVNCPG